MLEFISGLHPFILYPFLFVGVIVVGGVVLLPAMYLSLLGPVSLILLFLTAILAGISADSLWYYVGKSAKKERLYSLAFVQKRIEEAKKFSNFYTERGVLLAFLTKFVYGTRIASHVLAGMHKVNFMKFLGATALGTTVWFFIFYFLIRFIDLGIASVATTALRISLMFAIIVIATLLINFFSGKYLKRKILRSNS